MFIRKKLLLKNPVCQQRKLIVQDFTLYGRIQLKGKEGEEPGPATPLHLDLPALRKLQSQLLL
jgi:hypothetical protein